MKSSPSIEPVDVLLVEDNPGDVRLLEELFSETTINTNLTVVTDGSEAVAFLADEREAVPNLILLDLNLPGMDGFEVLDAIKDDPAVAHLPVLVLSSSCANEDVAASYDRHANAYLTKPVDPDEFASVIRAIEAFWFERTRLPSVPS